MKSKYTRGSEWRKWDLHLHTPSSFDYKDKSQTNEDILNKLVSKNIACAAVTDHHVLDVDRIKALQKLGEKQGVVFLPGMELRGDKRHKVPINIIAIFPEDSDIEHISSELLSKLNINKQRKTQKRGEDEIYVNTFDACGLIHELGGIVTVHAGNKSNSIEQCFPNALPVNVAEKLDLIEKIDIFEIATLNDIKNYREKVFPNINKTLALVKTSDNHDAKVYEFKDDVYCWIKADVTYDGLLQIIYEPDSRVFVGSEPPVLERIRANKTRYIDSLALNSNDDYKSAQGVWFNDIKIDFNKELIAIIGNKGSGKSAISDILGVLGNTHNAGARHSNLSFLNGNKFRKKGYAENFNAELVWEDKSGLGVLVPLNVEADTDVAERVRYLPQHYFENLTNDIEGKGFEETLKDVIFLHIPEAQRLESRTFTDLIDVKSKNIEAELEDLKTDVRGISEKIVKLEAKNHPSYKKQLDSFIGEKKKELVGHNKNKPKKVKDPSKPSGKDKVDKQKEKKYKELQQLNNDYTSISEKIQARRAELNQLTKERQELVDQKETVTRLEAQFDVYKEDNKQELLKHGLNVDDIVKATFNKKLITSKITGKDTLIKGLEKELRTKVSIDSDPEVSSDEKKLASAYKASLLLQQSKLQTQIDEIKKDLSQPEKDFQNYKEKLAQWEQKKKDIEGSSSELNTLKFYENEKVYIDKSLTTELASLRKDRTDKAIEIFKKKKEIIELYKTFKESIDKEIKKDVEFTKIFNMEIDVNFKLSPRFATNFLQFINKTKKGTFLGAIDKDVEELFSDKDLLDENDIIAVLDEVIECLECDRRELGDTPKERQISDQVIRVQGFYDFIFSLDYLKPIYELKLDAKTLDELSPGEKGTLLLVFYLMIDKEDIPLIIDQPEDNLDNKSVFQVLTRFIKSAKKRRQIIIVTHNPNLAVGADAEQIIYVDLDKKDGKNVFSHELGSIEDPHINARLVEILEGTMPAFDIRKLRYKNEPPTR
jgi:ABC-type lipoprotein export system ATPase subunit